MRVSLSIFVEGVHDKIFFDSIISEIRKYTGMHNAKIYIIPYSKKKNKLINNHINKSKKPNNFYLFISDRDSNYYPCITALKTKLINKYNSLEEDKIIVVEEEIESWYYSGLRNESLLNLPENLSYNCSKEEFDNSIPKNYEKINCLNEILKFFDYNLATQNNESFNYFIKKLTSIKAY